MGHNKMCGWRFLMVIYHQTFILLLVYPSLYKYITLGPTSCIYLGILDAAYPSGHAYPNSTRSRYTVHLSCYCRLLRPELLHTWCPQGANSLYSAGWLEIRGRWQVPPDLYAPSSSLSYFFGKNRPESPFFTQSIHICRPSGPYRLYRPYGLCSLFFCCILFLAALKPEMCGTYICGSHL